MGLARLKKDGWTEGIGTGVETGGRRARSWLSPLPHRSAASAVVEQREPESDRYPEDGEAEAATRNVTSFDAGRRLRSVHRCPKTPRQREPTSGFPRRCHS